MKKLFFPVLIILTVLFSACKDKKTEVEEPFSLVGKTYAAHHYSGNYRVMKFLSETKVEYTSRSDNPQGSIIGSIKNGTYNLLYPNISIKIDEYDNPINGIFVNEETFRTGAADDYTLLEYIKQ